jgi:hypothetical protein
MLINQPKNIAATAGYTLLEPSVIQPNPNSASGTPIGLTAYLNGIYVTFFILTIIGAIVILVWYGIEYMTSDIPGFKGNAKGRITKVFIGIGIALLSYIILQLINPDLIKINLDIGSLLNGSS